MARLWDILCQPDVSDSAPAPRLTELTNVLIRLCLSVMPRVVRQRRRRHKRIQVAGDPDVLKRAQLQTEIVKLEAVRSRPHVVLCKPVTHYIL